MTQIDKDWEKFTGGPFVPYAERMYVSLSGKGKLLLNRKSYEEIGKPQRVMLYFNRKKDLIGLRPVHDRLAEAFPVRKANGSFVFYIGTFLRHNGIRLDGTQKFVSPEVNDQGLLALDLTHTVNGGGWTRRMKKK